MGAGKTTLLECIAGLLPSDAGEVRWRGSPLPSARRKEQHFYVPEAILPYPDQRTSEVLTFLGGFYLAITLLSPFIAIRLIAAEKASGGLKLLMSIEKSLPGSSAQCRG